MSSAFTKYIFVSNLFSTFFMTGLIFLIQIVHYPLFDLVSEERFLKYHSEHSRLITFIVLPMMLTELMSSIFLIPDNPYLNRTMAILLLALCVGIWVSTAFVQVPYHNLLAGGKSSNLISKLTNSNWIRTLLWSLRSGILIWILMDRLDL
ncbi:MAG: hypothetical protein H7A24_18065 [Leptospiraceae bacterium]|nr:hypothetical protein [Leptospiraceae bacterium]MCP5513802.1 hypothetical protein [Leptospiraceae bacterium]